MDRLSWYQPGESMEEILCQSGHVGIFDGDLKQSAFEQGTASLTLQRVIWADSSDPDCRLILHHSLVERIERHHKTMFGRGGKIIVTLKPGPVAASGYNSLRFVFKNGGEEDFYKRYADALSRQTWKRTSSSSSSAGSGSRNSHAHSGSLSGQSGQRAAAVPGVEKRMNDPPNKIQESITQVIKIKTYLLSLGISDGSEAEYFVELAKQLDTIPGQAEFGGAMSLAEAYCYANRCREGELISPEDLLNACNHLEDINSAFRTAFSGLQLVSLDEQEEIEEAVRCVEKLKFAAPEAVSEHIGVNVACAMERLLAAESEALICRDETVDGIVFYPNRFQNEADGQQNHST
ncbi:Vacuolar protein-sorting-associated protein 36 [Aphelenchoides fujianensis]|nr:Vacuolar protein-sorting-associated protein 36 [Aphelenchoides fujianensis]